MATAKKPIVIRDKGEMRLWSRSMRLKGSVVALVPTMGYLHEGHLSLIKEARSHAQAIVVSIYVNPGQFSPNEDLATYPSDFEGDLSKLVASGSVDVVFNPPNLYDYGGDRSGGEALGNSDNCVCLEYLKIVSCVENKHGLRNAHESWVRVERLEKGLCGNSRPVFFRGVATIVTKLFNIVEPDVAIFGKKDYQQWKIIQRMVRDLDFSIQIVGSEIVREHDGLAMSSRNVHLSSDGRTKALSISRSLMEARLSAEKGQRDSHLLKDMVTQAIVKEGGSVDYAEIVDQETLEPVQYIGTAAVFCVAAWFERVRLIDNVEIIV